MLYRRRGKETFQNSIRVKIGKIVFLIAGVGFSILLAIVYFAFPRKNDDVRFLIKELPTLNNTEKIFIKKRNWGITGGSQQIIISKSDENEEAPDSNKNYIYKGLSSFYYKLQNDSLLVYVTNAASVPAQFKTSLKIRQIELENPLMMNLLENGNYKKKGLETIN